MEQYLLQTFGKKRSKDQPKKDKNQGSGNGDGNQEMQQGGNKSSAGRQLSKAERYRWIIQEPKQTTVAVQQPKAITNSSTKRDAPSGKQLTRKEQSVDDSAYNQKLLNSIVKGASDFKCKHCQEPFGKLDDLTRHMYQKE